MKVRIRMYRQGLGDCFLIRFGETPNTINILIDCGTLGATTTGVKIKQVVEDIKLTIGNPARLHLVVATHEHKDHLSGFRDQKAIFDTITIDQVWVAWTENKDDDLAKSLATDSRDLLNALRWALRSLGASPTSAKLHAGVKSLMEFYGEVGADNALLGVDFAKTVDEAMDYVMGRVDDPEMLMPGRMLTLPGLDGVRFYVLGPPHDKDKIWNLGTHESPELYHLAPLRAAAISGCARFAASGMSLANYLDQGLPPEEREAFERSMPVDARFRRELDDPSRDHLLATYDAPHAAWRRIDDAWLGSSADLAIQLDHEINNTSLALAMELVDDDRVLLFPADAQLGNWLSWHELTWEVPTPGGGHTTVTAADLLRRTVFYKVGHHASHNATVQEKGLEMMDGDDLVAFIPVDSTVAANKDWAMPAMALYTRLLEKTTGRTICSDTGWPTTRPSTISVADWDSARAAATNIAITDLFVELTLD